MSNEKKPYTAQDLYEDVLSYHKVKKWNGQVYLESDNVYTADKDIWKRVIFKIWSKASTTHINGVIERLEVNTIERDTELLDQEQYLTFTDELGKQYQITKDGVIETKGKFILNKLATKYKPDAAEEPVLTKFLDGISNYNEGVKKDILKSFALPFFRDNFQIGFMYYGPSAANGKSTLFELVSHTFGQDNCSNVKLNKLSESGNGGANQFQSHRMSNKLANLGDDISGQVIKDSSTLKSIISHDRAPFEKKGKDGKDVRYFAVQYHSTNTLPKVWSDEGWNRRWKIIPMLAHFSYDAEDERFKIVDGLNRLLQDSRVREDFLNRIVNVAVEILNTNKQELWSELTEQYSTNYEESNDPLSDFASRININDYNGAPTDVLHKRYINEMGTLADKFLSESIRNFNAAVRKKWPEAEIVKSHGNQNWKFGTAKVEETKEFFNTENFIDVTEEFK